MLSSSGKPDNVFSLISRKESPLDRLRQGFYDLDESDLTPKSAAIYAENEDSDKDVLDEMETNINAFLKS